MLSEEQTDSEQPGCLECAKLKQAPLLYLVFTNPILIASNGTSSEWDVLHTTSGWQLCEKRRCHCGAQRKLVYLPLLLPATLKSDVTSAQQTLLQELGATLERPQLKSRLVIPCSDVLSQSDIGVLQQLDSKLQNLSLSVVNPSTLAMTLPLESASLPTRKDYEFAKWTADQVLQWVDDYPWESDRVMRQIRKAFESEGNASLYSSEGAFSHSTVIKG